MSFSIGSIINQVSSALPGIMQGAMVAGMSSTPQGALLGILFGAQAGGSGPMGGLGSWFNNFQQITGLVGSVLTKLAGMTKAQATPLTQASDGGTPGATASGRDTTQAKIQGILNGNYSIEEKIILIAGVVTDSMSEELNECLKEQGKMAKKTNSGGANSASTSDVASAQNVENRIQILMQRINRMQSLASNIIQSMHATKKAQIQNIRV